jgi:hypothetical protein
MFDSQQFCYNIEEIGIILKFIIWLRRIRTSDKYEADPMVTRTFRYTF